MYIQFRSVSRLILDCLLFACLAVGALADTSTVRFGNVTFRPPEGWKQTKGSNFLSFVPSDAAADRPKIALAVYAPAPLEGRSLAGWLDNFTKTAHKGYEEKRQTEGRAAEQANGIKTYGKSYALEQNGSTQLRTYLLAGVGSQVQVFLFVSTDPQSVQQYASALTNCLSSIAPATGAGTEEKSSIPEHTAESNTPEPAAKSVKAGSAEPILRGLWLNVGPTTRSRDGSHEGPVHIKDVAIDLTDHTVYVAAIAVADFSPHGGIFASTDNGRIWRELYNRDCQQIIPTGGDRLYALENTGSRIVVSDDRGKTWRRLPKLVLTFPGYRLDADIECIAASPANSNILYAGASGVDGAGLYRSVDGGNGWTKQTKTAKVPYDKGTLEVRDTTCSDLTVDPGDANIVYAAFNGVLCQSNDGGAHFYGCIGIGTGAGPTTRQSLTTTVVHPGRVQIDPVHPNLGYLRAVENNTDKLYRTPDGGRTWNRVQIPGVSFINTIALHPGAPQIVYVATERGIYVSSDAGRNWKSLQSADAPKSSGGFTIPFVFTGTAFNAVGTVVHNDEPILINPETGHLLYGTAAGIRILVRAK